MAEPETTSQVSQAILTRCDERLTTAERKAGQKRATKAWSYLLGNDSVAMAQGGLAGDSFREDIAVVRAGLASGTVTLAKGAAVTVCGLPAQEWQLSAPNSTAAYYALRTLSSGANPGVEAVFGANTASWFGIGFERVYTDGRQSGITASFDPEPSVLTADLGSATGAAAAAVYTNSGEAFTAVKFGSLPSSCGTVVGGTPCSTTALSSGTPLTKTIFQSSGSTCSCR